MNWSFEIPDSADPDGSFKKALEKFNNKPFTVPACFPDIVKLLIANGFKIYRNGMERETTGCGFLWEDIAKYKSVLDFQLDWPYTYP